MRMRSVAVAAGLVLFLGGWLPSTVTASPLTVSLSNGITTVTCADGAACDTSPLTGVVSFTSPVATITLSLTGVGSGSPALPGLMMDLAYNVTQTVAGTGGTMVIQASETDQTANAALFHAVLGGTQLTGTTAFSIFDSATNTLFAQTASICSAGPASTAGAVALSCDGGPLTGAAFSLTEIVTLQIPAGAYSGSGDLLLTARQQVPAPSALLLLGLGLTVAGVLRARVRL